MPVLTMRGVGAAWAASGPILDAVSLSLERGFYGLVGANGAGKTTLLSVLASELAPIEGAVARWPRDASIAHCRQEIVRRDRDVDTLAAREDGAATELRGRLALDPAALERWETLSPGERKRWQVGAALAREPDVLLLDEPTNHLDGEARARLMGALRRYSGLCVIVSHDRAVLDALTTSTLRIHRRQVTTWPGSYSQAKALWERARAELEQEARRASARVRAAEAHLDAARRTQAAAATQVSAGRRMRDRHDSDARGALAGTKASWAASKAGRVTAVARSSLERARREVPDVERDVRLGGRVFAGYERAPRPVLFHLELDAVHRGQRAVLRDLCVTVGREDRLRVEGPNGAGKTTLLDALMASTAHPERVLYLPQELPLSARESALDELRGLQPDARGRTLSIFAALGSEPERLLRRAPEHLSPGEARKLVLARALASHVWALVLDEPTNHMDLPSVERLEVALAQYPGALVLVTHDDALAARLTTRALHVKDGAVASRGGAR